MTPDQFRQALSLLNLTQVGAAKRWGINPRTVRRYCAGTPIPVLVQRLVEAEVRIVEARW